MYAELSLDYPFENGIDMQGFKTGENSRILKMRQIW